MILQYIKDFEIVLDFAREGAKIEKICFYTGMSRALVKEYLEIIKESRLADYEGQKE